MMTIHQTQIDFDYEIRAEQRRVNSKKKPLSANAWRFNDSGSAEPTYCSFDNIFAAWIDYKQSLSWE